MTLQTAVVLDVGSTNARAWWVEQDLIVRRETAAVGVRDAARTGSTRIVRDAVRDLIRAVSADQRPDARLAAGMITSGLGVRDVPHVVAPAGPDDLARAAVVIEAADLAEGPVILFPGVKTDGADPLAQDVMRGEEALAIGLLANGGLTPGAFLLNVGSHWKLIELDGRGRIARSRTSLGGEVVHAVQNGTVLGASLPDGPLEAVDERWLRLGAAATRQEGFLRALFGVRLLDLAGTTTPAQRFAWLIGATIACDLDALLHARSLPPGASVALTGPGAVPEAWRILLAESGHPTARVVAPADAELAFVRGVLDMEARRRHLAP